MFSAWAVPVKVDKLKKITSEPLLLLLFQMWAQLTSVRDLVSEIPELKEWVDNDTITEVFEERYHDFTLFMDEAKDDSHLAAIEDSGIDFQRSAQGLYTGGQYPLVNCLRDHHRVWQKVAINMKKVTQGSLADFGYYGMNMSQIVILAMVGKMSDICGTVPDDFKKLLEDIQPPPSHQQDFNKALNGMISHTFARTVPKANMLYHIYEVVLRDLCARVSSEGGLESKKGTEFLEELMMCPNLKEAEAKVKELYGEGKDQKAPDEPVNLMYGFEELKHEDDEVAIAYDILRAFEMQDFAYFDRLLLESQLMLRMYEVIQHPRRERTLKTLFNEVKLLEIKKLPGYDRMWKYFKHPRIKDLKTQRQDVQFFVRFECEINERKYDLTLPSFVFYFIFNCLEESAGVIEQRLFEHIVIAELLKTIEELNELNGLDAKHNNVDE